MTNTSNIKSVHDLTNNVTGKVCQSTNDFRHDDIGFIKTYTRDRRSMVTKSNRLYTILILTSSNIRIRLLSLITKMLLRTMNLVIFRRNKRGNNTLTYNSLIRRLSGKRLTTTNDRVLYNLTTRRTTTSSNGHTMRLLLANRGFPYVNRIRTISTKSTKYNTIYTRDISSNLRANVLRLLYNTNLARTRIRANITSHISRILYNTTRLLLTKECTNGIRLTTRDNNLFGRNRIVTTRHYRANNFRANETTTRSNSFLFLHYKLSTTNILMTILHIRRTKRRLAILSNVNTTLITTSTTTSVTNLPNDSLNTPIKIYRRQTARNGCINRTTLSSAHDRFNVRSAARNTSQRVSNLFSIPNSFSRRTMKLCTRKEGNINRITNIINLHGIRRVRTILCRPLNGLRNINFIGTTLTTLQNSSKRLMISSRVQRDLTSNTNRRTNGTSTILRATTRLVNTIIRTNKTRTTIRTITISLSSIRANLLYARYTNARLVSSNRRRLLTSLVNRRRRIIVRTLARLVGLFLRGRAISNICIMLQIRRLSTRLNTMNICTINRYLRNESLTIIGRLKNKEGTISKYRVTRGSMARATLYRANMRTRILLTSRTIFLMTNNRQKRRSTIFGNLSTRLSKLRGRILRAGASLRVHFTLRVYFSRYYNLFLRNNANYRHNGIITTTYGNIRVKYNMRLYMAITNTLIRRAIVINTRRRRQTIMTLNLNGKIKILYRLMIGNRLMTRALRINMILTNLRGTINTLNTTRPRPNTQTRRGRTIKLSSQYTKNNGMTTRTLTKRRRLFTIRVKLFDNPYGSVLYVNIRTIGTRVLRLTITLTITMRVRPNTTSTLHYRDTKRVNMRKLMTTTTTNGTIRVRRGKRLTLNIKRNCSTTRNITVTIFGLGLWSLRNLLTLLYNTTDLRLNRRLDDLLLNRKMSRRRSNGYGTMTRRMSTNMTLPSNIRGTYNLRDTYNGIMTSNARRGTKRTTKGNTYGLTRRKMNKMGSTLITLTNLRLIMISNIISRDPSRRLRTKDTRVTSAISSSRNREIISKRRRRSTRRSNNGTDTRTTPLLLTRLINRELNSNGKRRDMRRTRRAKSDLGFGITRRILVRMNIRAISRKDASRTNRTRRRGTRRDLVIESLLRRVRMIRLFTLQALERLRTLLTPCTNSLRTRRARRDTSTNRRRRTTDRKLIIRVRRRKTSRSRGNRRSNTTGTTMTKRYNTLTSVVNRRTKRDARKRISTNMRHLMRGMNSRRMNRARTMISVTCVSGTGCTRRYRKRKRNTSPQSRLTTLNNLTKIRSNASSKIVRNIPSLNSRRRSARIRKISLRSRNMRSQ